MEGLGQTRHERVVGHDDLSDRVERARRSGSRIVMTNGCFDVLHRGHTTYLEQAADLGDLLVVAINSDESVRRLKGPGRPVNCADDRAAVLAALRSVDLITIFDTATPVPLVERIRPDVYVKGGDYLPHLLPEATVVESYGGTVRILDYLPDLSSTMVLERMGGHRA